MAEMRWTKIILQNAIVGHMQCFENSNVRVIHFVGEDRRKDEELMKISDIDI